MDNYLELVLETATRFRRAILLIETKHCCNQVRLMRSRHPATDRYHLTGEVRRAPNSASTVRNWYASVPIGSAKQNASSANVTLIGFETNKLNEL